MMNSATSTDAADKAAAAAVARRKTYFVAIVVSLVAAFAVLLAIAYDMRFTFATVFWFLGWCSFLAAGMLVYKAARAFDPDAALEMTIETMTVTDQRRVELEREKKILLKAIKEVEFDQAMGKVDEIDAVAVIGRYRSRAREILRLLEGDKQADYQTAVEKELAKRMAKAGVDPAAVGASGAASASAAPASAATEKACGSCEARNDDDAEFCKKCGARL